MTAGSLFATDTTETSVTTGRALRAEICPTLGRMFGVIDSAPKTEYGLSFRLQGVSEQPLLSIIYIL